jgi:hypothetical protein
MQYTSNKGFAEDLTEGKISFLVVHGMLTLLIGKSLVGTSQFTFYRFC